MSDFGERIRARRKELKLSLRELGVRCGLSATFLCEIETGKRGIGADSLLSISQALGIPMDQLMKGGERQTSGVEVRLPASLMALASEQDLPFRNVLCLYWLATTINDHRQGPRRTNLDVFDWVKLYEAVKEWL